MRWLIKSIPTQVSESVRRRNPHLYQVTTGELPTGETISIVVPKKRLRQSTKPLMNKLEQRLFDKLSRESPYIHAQSITFRLANGVKYTPDLFCFEWKWKMETCAVAWEVKGPWMTDDSIVKLKVFAKAYPMIVVLLSSEKDGFWSFQEVWS